MKFYISNLPEYKDLPIVHQCNFAPKTQYMINGENYQYGEAIENKIYYNKYHNNFLISNDEYCSIINFCPWCGINLNLLIKGNKTGFELI